MNVDDWIRTRFFLDRDEAEIIIRENEYIVGVSIVDFVSMFGDAIQHALDNDLNVVQAIKDSDANNELGYNDLL
ncbi:hypothetical protein [Sporosarcina sp. FSL K6-2383]|uniref:hypothetical protein n=1 Tax=Sporosarcina sp. FSL K6-2383 TaxID=2921556 RepID=UPI003159C91F